MALAGIPFVFKVLAPSPFHEVVAESCEGLKYIAHAFALRSYAELIPFALNHEFDIPIAVGEIGRNSDGLGVPVFEKFGFGHDESLFHGGMYAYILWSSEGDVNTWMYGVFAFVRAHRNNAGPEQGAWEIGHS